MFVVSLDDLVMVYISHLSGFKRDLPLGIGGGRTLPNT